MKIAFFGDSLTEGIPGASYFDRLRDQLPEHQLMNYGKGGDTVISLYSRLRKLPPDSFFDIALLWVGVNDIFVHVSRTYPFLKRIRRQPWAKDIEDFKNSYEILIYYLTRRCRRLITVTPLFIGEDPDSSWNRDLDELASVIEALSRGKSGVHCLNLRRMFHPYLEGKSLSSFEHRPVLQSIQNALNIKKSSADSSSTGPWHFTIDGVHLNADGADLVAEIFLKAIRSFLNEPSRE